MIWFHIQVMKFKNKHLLWFLCRK